jgi:hypothetical protein
MVKSAVIESHPLPLKKSPVIFVTVTPVELPA